MIHANPALAIWVKGPGISCKFSSSNLELELVLNIAERGACINIACPCLPCWADTVKKVNAPFNCLKNILDNTYAKKMPGLAFRKQWDSPFKDFVHVIL